MKTADLHFHSTFSDGKHSIDELSTWLDAASQDGLSLAVLTDHDGVAGFEIMSQLQKSWWAGVCASEFSCEFEDSQVGRVRGLHLLVYGIDPQDEDLKSYFEKFRETREQRAYKIIENLKSAGIPIDGDQLVQRAKGAVLGRPHIADALVEAGVVKSRSEAFDLFLNDQSPYNVKKYRLSLKEACQFAKRKGWKTSVAHPGQHGFKENQLKHFRDLGVDALEIFHPRHTRDDLIFYREQAKALGFKISGGSDFHDQSSDRRGDLPSIGRTEYLLDDAKRFLGDLI